MLYQFGLDSLEVNRIQFPFSDTQCLKWCPPTIKFKNCAHSCLQPTGPVKTLWRQVKFKGYVPWASKCPDTFCATCGYRPVMAPDRRPIQ